MVEVKMSGAEYVEFVEAKRALGQLKQELLDSYKISVEDGNFRIRHQVVMPAELKKQLIDRVVKTLKENPEVLKRMFVDSEPVVDLHHGWTSGYWGKVDDTQYDVRTDKEIGEMWERMAKNEAREVEMD